MLIRVATSISGVKMGQGPFCCIPGKGFNPRFLLRMNGEARTRGVGLLDVRIPGTGGEGLALRFV
jgi:hypothetical protein